MSKCILLKNNNLLMKFNEDENENEEINENDIRVSDDGDESDNMEISEQEIIEIENDLIETSNVDNVEECESDLDIYFKFGTNNHKLMGKHSLKRDTIFNGKITESTGEFGQIDDEYNYTTSPVLEKGTSFEEESIYSNDVRSKRELAKDIFDILSNKTDIDFNSPRRKPNKITFNEYYKLIIDSVGKKYSKCDIFVELAYYFTDNHFNMYKLLEKKYAMGIIYELSLIHI